MYMNNNYTPHDKTQIASLKHQIPYTYTNHYNVIKLKTEIEYKYANDRQLLFLDIF